MEKLPFLMFKDHSSLEFGLLISEKGSYKWASRDITYTSVPGRNGDLIIDNGRYKNVNIPYKLTLLNNTKYEFEELANQIRGWLLTGQAYFPLWDSYDKKYFRLGSYSTEVDIEQELRGALESEISSDHIGEMVMDRLKDMDEVAYVRFASVYRSFKDINTFMDELTKLLGDKK